MNGKSTDRPATVVGPVVDPDRVRTVLGEGDAVGGFFALSTREAEATDPAWRPLATLLDPAEDGPDPLDERLEAVAAGLGADRRIAASLLAQSLASRAVSILLAAGTRGILAHLSPRDVLQWRPWAGGPLPLWADPARLTGTALGDPDEPAAGEALAAEIADVHLEPLVAGIRARASVSPRVLWGNAASALAGAVRVLGEQRPDRHDAALALARSVLAHRPFAGLGRFVAQPAHPSGIGFARTTCCLYYRVPGGGMCEDCVLVRERDPGP